jgi:hypothetical protein
MSGPKRNPDKLNTIGVVVVGICGSVLVYVTIVALQAFYQNDTAEIQTMADYGGNDVTARNAKSTQQAVIMQYGKNAGEPGALPTSYRIPIDQAMKLVVEGAKVDPANLVPTQGRSDRPSIKPIFGRPQALDTPAAGSAAPAAAGSAAAPTMPPETPTEGLGPGGAPPATSGPGSAAKGNVP